MKLRVLLLRPYSDADELIPPFGLGYLATAIRARHDVQILDGIKEKLTLESLGDLINPHTKNFGVGIKKENFDVAGIQVFTHHINTVKNYIKVIKEILPETFVILGGPHPSSSPNDIFEYFPEADFAFRGEAEIGLAQLLNSIALGKTDFSNI